MALHAPEEPFTARLRISFLFLEFSVDVLNGAFTSLLKAVRGGTAAKGARKCWLVVVNCVADKLTQPR